MTAQKKKYEGGIKKGETRNPNGRPKGSGLGARSKLRGILSKFEEMCKTQAPQIIQDSLNGENVDKEKLATAKWVVGMFKGLHAAAIQEEQMKLNAKNANKEDVVIDDEDDDTPRAAQFSLHIIDNKTGKETKLED